jgi:5-hydroxyisourate hydrolase-like protein (transthyretin family)
MFLRTPLVLLLAGIVAFAMAAPACAKPSIWVSVSDGGKPIQGAKVKIERVDDSGQLQPVTEATTNADGIVSAEVEEGTEYRITTTSGDKQGTMTIKTGSGEAYRSTMYSGTVNTHRRDHGAYLATNTQALAERARSAAQACDRKTYDDAVERIRTAIAETERQLAEAQAAAEDYRRRAEIPYSTLQQAKKALKSAKAMPAGAQNEDRLEALEDYVEDLEVIEKIEGDLQKYRKDLQSVPPFPDTCPDDKHGMAPPSGGCPEGKFAGGLGGLLGLPVACDDPSRRRETEREREKDRKD